MAELKRRTKKPLTYGGYLQLNGLLELQRPLAKPVQHDELLFIVSHQTYELWFKTVLHELETATSLIYSGRLREASRLIRRVVTIEKVLIQQLEVLETIRPGDFLKFRDSLGPASGFQSWQFREIEFVAGHKDQRFLELHGHDRFVAARLKKRFDSPSLWDAFLFALRREGFATGGDGGLGGVVQVYALPEHADMAELAEALLEFDKQFWLWRNHHMGMVERIIGRKIGTGSEVIKETFHYSFDSAGVAYLKTTLRRRFFPVLWAARTSMSGSGTG